MNLTIDLKFVVSWFLFGLICTFFMTWRFGPKPKEIGMYNFVLLCIANVFAGYLTYVIYLYRLACSVKMKKKVTKAAIVISEFVTKIDEEANKLNECFRIPRYLLINKKLYDCLCKLESMRKSAKPKELFLSVYTTLSEHNLEIILIDIEIPGGFKVLPYAEEVRTYLMGEDIQWKEVKDEHAE